MVLMFVRIIPFLFNIDQIGISRGHICFPSVPPFPQKYQQNKSLPEAIMVGRDRDRCFAVSFLNKGAEPTELTFVYKNSARNIDYLLYECFKMRNLGVVSLNYAHGLLSGGLCLRQPRNQHAQQVSVKSETFGRCLNSGCFSVFQNSSFFQNSWIFQKPNFLISGEALCLWVLAKASLKIKEFLDYN